MMPNQLFGKDTMNAPWGLPARLKLVLLACRFFTATKLADNYKLVGKEVPKGGNPEPLTAGDFLRCLETRGAFPKPPNGLRVMQLIDRMVSCGILVRAGYGNRSFAGIGDLYLHMETEWDEHRKHFRYAPVLGSEFLYHLCAPGPGSHHGNGQGNRRCGCRDRIYRRPITRPYLPSRRNRHDGRREADDSGPGVRRR